MGANTEVEIDARPVPQEPMVSHSEVWLRSLDSLHGQYLLANLGMSFNFGNIDFERITWPAVMLVDYIRVYQDPSALNIGCDPTDFPTAAYINECVACADMFTLVLIWFAGTSRPTQTPT